MSIIWHKQEQSFFLAFFYLYCRLLIINVRHSDSVSSVQLAPTDVTHIRHPEKNCTAASHYDVCARWPTPRILRVCCRVTTDYTWQVRVTHRTQLYNRHDIMRIRTYTAHDIQQDGDSPCINTYLTIICTKTDLNQEIVYNHARSLQC